MMARTLLVIEDEALLAQEIERHYVRDKWRVAVAPTLRDARRLLREQGLMPLVIISDMSLPDGNALDLLEESGAGDSEWIFLTGYGTVADSVRASLPLAVNRRSTETTLRCHNTQAWFSGFKVQGAPCSVHSCTLHRAR